MDNLKKIAAGHELSGILYPRPTFDCPDCPIKLILCWGTDKNPYLRHKSGNLCPGGKNHGESLLHKLAKEKLVEYLNKEGKANLISCCKGCGIELSKISTPPDLTYHNEVGVNYNGEKYVLDIAGMKDNGVHFNIEVYHSHRTNNSELREKIQWTEVNASEVLDKLNEDRIPEEITIENVRIKRCEECSHINDIGLEGIAIKLGYLELSPGYSREYHEIDDILGNHSEGRLWYLYPKRSTFNDGKYWKFLIKNRKCIRCNSRQNITYRKPFCKRCYVDIISEEQGEEVIQQYPRRRRKFGTIN